MAHFHKIFNFLILSLIIIAKADAQVTVTATVGTLSGSYTTLKDAFDAINNGTHKGAINIRIHQNTTETESSRLDSSGVVTGASYTSVLIQPADTATVVKTVSLAVSGAIVVDMNGADNVTIDGRPMGTGTSKLLKLQHANPSTNISSIVLRLINGVSFFTARYLNSESLTGIGTTSANTPNISLSTSTATTGNYRVAIDNCNITGGVIGMSIAGTTANYMDSIFITNNTITNAQAVCLTANNVKFLSVVSNTFSHTVTISGWNVTGVTLTPNISGAVYEFHKNMIVNLGSSSAAQIFGLVVTPSLAIPAIIPQVSITNNYIGLMATNAPVNAIRGFQFLGTTSPAIVTALFNTIRIGGSGNATGSNPATVGVFKSNSATSTSFTFSNNICINTRTGSANPHIGYWNFQPTLGILNSDYNTTWGGPNYMAAWGGFFMGTEADLKAAASPNEQHTNINEITFLNSSTPELAAGNLAIAMLGVPAGGVTTDINGNLRSTSTPFRGAIEGDPLLLPVRLLSFAASRKKDNVLLNWETTAESNNRGFNIERSVNGNSFTTVGFAASVAQGALTNNYTFTDVNAFNTAGASIIYYRLKQIDIDGRHMYSPIQRVSFEKGLENEVSVYPNPIQNFLNLNVNSTSTGMALVEIVDVSGKVLINTQKSLVIGENNFVLPEVKQLQPGIYFLKLIKEDKTTIIKIVKGK